MIGRRILVVDDEEHLRRVTQLKLQQAGYEASTAGDGVEALRLLATHPQDLVLTDLKMPGMSGIELLQKIRAEYPEVIVVMGNTATRNLLNAKLGITKLRGEFQDYHGVKVMPTFHPAYLLRDPSKKQETWQDLKKVRDYLETSANSNP